MKGLTRQAVRAAGAALWVAAVLLVVFWFVSDSPLVRPVFDALGLPTPTPLYACGAGHPTPTGCSIDMIGR